MGTPPEAETWSEIPVDVEASVVARLPTHDHRTPERPAPDRTVRSTVRRLDRVPFYRRRITLKAAVAYWALLAAGLVLGFIAGPRSSRLSASAHRVVSHVGSLHRHAAR